MGEVYRATDSQAQARGRDQGAAGGVHRGPGAPGALRARGAAPGAAPPSATSRRSSGSRSRAACARWSWSWSRGRRSPSGWSAGRCRVDEALADRAADRRRRSRRRTRRGSSTATSSRRTSRLAPRRQGQGARLRARQGDGSGRQLGRAADLARSPTLMNSPTLTGGRHAARRDPRHRGLHGARAGARRRGRQARRHLGVRRRALRDARPAARSSPATR